MRITSEQAREELASHGITMIGEYIGTNTPILCICKCGNEYHAYYKNIRRGFKSFCEDCRLKKKQSQYVLPIEKVIETCNKFGMQYVLGYVNVDTPMKIICVCGRERLMTLTNIKKGRKCNCNGRKKEKHHMWRPDRDVLMEERKFKKACYTMVSRCMNRKTNTQHTEELLGYTSEQLQDHIKNHPDYESVKSSGKRLSIDHIIPLQAFKDHNMLSEDYVWLINHLDNLRPMTNSWNSTKHSKYDQDEFISYIAKHGVKLPHV